MTTNDAATVALGTTDQGRKVHKAFSASGKLLCAHTPTAPRMTEVITDLPDGGKQTTIAALLEHKIRPSRLCANCFSIRFRADYAAVIRALAT